MQTGIRTKFEKRARLSTIASAVLFFVANASLTSALAQNLEPAWDWSAPSGVEWAVPAGGDRPSAILLATRDGKLHQFQIISGAPRFAEPIAIGKGGRFVSATADTAIICSESEVIAVSVQSGPHTDRPAAKELWRTKVVGEELPTPDGDPEFRPRLLSAIGTSAGVLAARSDGRIAELGKVEGNALWSSQVPAASEVRLYSDPSIAVALHRGKKGIDATFINRKAPSSPTKTVDFADTWPMVADWTRDGLIAAWPNRVVLLKSSGELSRVPLSVKWPLKAERLGILQSASPTSRPLLAVLDANGQLSLHDVTTGEVVWNKSDSAFRDGHIEIEGPHVIVLGNRGIVAAFARDSADPIARYAASLADPRNDRPTFGEWHTASAAPGFLFAAFSNTHQGGASANAATIDVLRTPIFRPGDWSVERAKAGERIDSLGAARGIRGVFWMPGRIIVVRDKSIQVFVL